MKPKVWMPLVMGDRNDLDLGAHKAIDQGVRITPRERVAASVRLSVGVTRGSLEHCVYSSLELEEEAASCEWAAFCVPVAGTLRIEESLDVPAWITRNHRTAEP